MYPCPEQEMHLQFLKIELVILENADGKQLAVLIEVDGREIAPREERAAQEISKRRVGELGVVILARLGGRHGSMGDQELG